MNKNSNWIRAVAGAFYKRSEANFFLAIKLQPDLIIRAILQVASILRIKLMIETESKKFLLNATARSLPFHYTPHGYVCAGKRKHETQGAARRDSRKFKLKENNVAVSNRPKKTIAGIFAFCIKRA